jgi:glycosyltransferase involved in cell wall biosynthesis
MLGTASIIVGTYNDLEILEAHLAAFAVQSHQDFELIFADDGSNQDYAPVLKAWAPRFRHGFQLATHPKNGFRKARILNRAIQASRFDRLIFIDLDCLPHRDFIKTHLTYLKPGFAITGRRAQIARDAVPKPAEILERGLGYHAAGLMSLWLRGKAHALERGVVLPIFYESKGNDLVGSNFSVWRKDLYAVNGFNEEFQGWGKEDTDLGLRLQLNNVRVRNLRNKVIVFHLIHERKPLDNPHNEKLMKRTILERSPRSPVGLEEIRDGDFTLIRY